jgi:predicted acyl esterase
VAPYGNLALPYRRHYERELAAIPPGEPVKSVFDLLTTAYHFHRGNRIRITVAFTDADNLSTPALDPPPQVRLLRVGMMGYTGYGTPARC